MNAQRGEVCIWLRHDALIVANDGKPVTRRGVLALCASDLTEKSEYADELPDDIPGVSDVDFLDEIRTRTIATYRVDPNRQKRDARRERAVSADYGGRYLWELLQNADDAMAPEGESTTHLIGTKGLGFKSVLEISDRPEVFSRPFAFRFSQDASQLLLRKHLQTKASAPVFEIPHTVTVSAEIHKLLQRGYATIICLPFRDEQARAKVNQAIAALNHHFLLFSQNLKRLRVIFGESDITTHIMRFEPRSGRQKIILSTGVATDPSAAQRWTKWFDEWEHGKEDKRLSVAVCLPADAGGLSGPLGEAEFPPAYVFFPTEEQIGARAIIHASFELTQNRKYFRDDERSEEICTKLRGLFTKLIGEVPAEVTLKAFGHVDPERTKGIAHRIATTLLDAVKESSFVPTIDGGKVRPGEVTTCSARFGNVLRSDAVELKWRKLLHPTVTHCYPILSRLGAKQIDLNSFLMALRYCKNESLQACKNVVNVLVKEALPALRPASSDGQAHELRHIPCWWTDKHSARSLDGRPFLFEWPKEWPEFVPADALAREARDHLHEIEDTLARATEKGAKIQSDEKRKVWDQYVSQQFLRSKSAYFEHALVSAMSRMDEGGWNREGWNVLTWYRKWADAKHFSDILPLPLIEEHQLTGTDGFRRGLSGTLRVPTDKGWRPAGQCYADFTWGAPSSFGAYFRTLSDRAVLRPLGEWHVAAEASDDLDVWKGLLRFAGVSWEPKIIRRHTFPNQTLLERTYRTEFLSDFTRIEFDIEIEHFPGCFIGEQRSFALITAGRGILATARKHHARYLRANKKNSDQLKTNFAEHQLRESAWLLHRGSILYPQDFVLPREAYLPGKGVEGLLPEIDIPDVGSNEKKQIITFLESLGVVESLPEDWISWLQWMMQIADIADQGSSDKNAVFVAAKMLYRMVLQRNCQDQPFASRRLRVPCFVGGESSGHVRFISVLTAKWLDDPIFDVPNIREQLLRHGYCLFILYLTQAGDAGEWLGLQRLSDCVSLLPSFHEIDEDGTVDAVQRYRMRLRALKALVPESRRSRLRDDLAIQATSSLSIGISSKEGKIISAGSARAFRTEHGTLLVVGGNSLFRGLGFGLAHHIVGDPRLTASFEAILAADSEDEVIERLREHSIPEQEVESVREAVARENLQQQVAVSESDSKSSFEGEEGLKARVPEDRSAARGAEIVHRSVPQPTTILAENAVPPPHTVGNLEGGSNDPSGANAKSSGTSRGAADLKAVSLAGQHAEDWLHEKLVSAFPLWQLVRRERDPHNRESDFVLRRDGKTFHIEAKRVGSLPGLMYWPDLQFSKATELQERYCLAVLLQSADAYEVSWIWEPTTRLGKAERYIEWAWEGKRSELLQPGAWSPSTPKPQMAPRSHLYRITVDRSLYQSLQADTPDLPMLKKRIQQVWARNR